MTYQFITAKKEIVTATLKENDISVSIRKNGEEKIHELPYSSTKEVMLNVQEERYSMAVLFKEPFFQLSLNTDSFGKIDQEGNVTRSFIAVSKNDTAAQQRREEYKLFVLQFHQKLIEKNLGGKIAFTSGGKILITFVLFFLLGLFFWIFPMAIGFSQYVSLVILGFVILRMAVVVYKLGWRSRPYNPHAIPAHLLPV